MIRSKLLKVLPTLNRSLCRRAPLRAFSSSLTSSSPQHLNLQSSYQSDRNQVYLESLDKARIDCIANIKNYNSSAYLFSKFYPESVRNTFICVQALNIELSKLSLGYQNNPSPTRSQNKEFNNFKFEFWNEQLDKCFEDQYQPLSSRLSKKLTGDPVTTLLKGSLNDGIQIDLQMLKQMVSSHQSFYNNQAEQGFDTIESMCSFGEGTYSQMNYIMQSALLSPSISPISDFSISILEQPGDKSQEVRNLISDIAAHLGQANSIASFIIGLRYHASSKNLLIIPLDVLEKHRVSQEDIFRLVAGRQQTGADFEELREILKNIIFDIATVANDHIITARMKLKKLKDEGIPQLVEQSNNLQLQTEYLGLNHGLPDAIFLPFLSGLPAVLYLERLQKRDFDIFNSKLQLKEWRLAWKAYQSFNSRNI